MCPSSGGHPEGTNQEEAKMRNSTYIEDLLRAEARESERAMVFAALRQRRARVTPQRAFGAVLRLLGVL
jgi:hypothetical protein